LEVGVFDSRRPFREATSDFQFAGAVAEFGVVLRDSPHKGQATLEEVIGIAEQNRGKDSLGYREFIRLARSAQGLKR
jgi:Ca-activated chloride channel family protein